MQGIVFKTVSGSGEDNLVMKWDLYCNRIDSGNLSGPVAM